MEMLNRFEPLALLLLIVGALNWGILALTETNVVAEIFGTGTLTDVIYVLVGIAGLLLVPRLFASVTHGHGPHPHRA